ncbi:uncharacterized protein LOC121734010 [Aricia agestis]|uniref:uncharacterized protein LOC121734010 n=1 Tax=Aricia agestis TaxID=91739 RepID=UPI001C2021F8|nr:uncharacterized protein LOC121734010 [Aricia agestis]XP_041980358.1 uncharacterized protein LOC121734010 [Aricia agestis]
MQYPMMGRDGNSGHVNKKMVKTVNGTKNPLRKESNSDNIVGQLCTRLQNIKDREDAPLTGMPSCSIEQTEAVRRYYAAFPALKKGQESPLQYYLPPPAWCRKTAPETKVKMQSEISAPKDWNSKNKKYSSGRERRNSCHSQKKNRKRFNSYRRTLESKENLPEWMTHEGVWDMEAQDPVKEFIRAIALDEGYGTCENTVTEEVKEINQVKRVNDENMVPDFDDGLDLDTEWGALTEDLIPRVRSPLEVEQYAKFEAKFDSSIEAIWTNQQNTPDDEYQELPIDFQDLLSSPSDRLFADPAAENTGLLLAESIWAADAGGVRAESPGDLPARLRPLNIEDEPRALEFALADGRLDDALAAVADTMRSFAAINHSRERSGFAEVVPRRPRPPPPAAPAPAPPVPAPPPREDLLTAARTHFRPIEPARDAEPARYRDGATFAVRADLDPVEFVRSESGGAYRADTRERYLEYRTRTIDYGRLALTAEQRCPDLDDPALRLRFPVRQRDAAAQTDEPGTRTDEPGGAAKKMRPGGDDIWGAAPPCACAAPPAVRDDDELSRDWEELLAAIGAAHALCASEAEADAAAGADRKRRHSAALRCAAPARCPRPHARFLRCSHRPLTR